MIKKLRAKFLRFLFIDEVVGRPVNLYECKDGTKFMAHSKLESIFFSVRYKEKDNPNKPIPWIKNKYLN